MHNQFGEFHPLLGDLSKVPADYIRDVAFTKRFLERWTMDPRFRDAYEKDAEAAIASLGIDLRPEQCAPLIDKEVAIALTRALANGDASGHPVSALRYRAFIQEKIAHRRGVRADGEPANRRLATWRKRQVNRCRGELGPVKADAIVHAPAALEIAKGCSVGCWFCGVAAPKFDHTWPYTPENARLWRGVLRTLGDVIGPCARQGFLYWATDPLDNPDYERFLVDFHEILGRCPQTTTAMAPKDIERTRRLLQLSHSLGSAIDRFSIIALNNLYRIHEAMSPEEMLRVECVPQNREATEKYLKANAGRARKFAHKRQAELAPEEASSTIACVSGFLFNMIDRSVRLITPCNASDRWPLGYWVLASGTFESSGELRSLLETMIDKKLRVALGVADIVRLRPDVRAQVERGDLRIVSRGLGITVSGQPHVDDLAAMLAEGTSAAGEIALRRERDDGVPLAETLALLDGLFGQGLLDEEPSVPGTPAPDRPEYAAQDAR